MKEQRRKNRELKAIKEEEDKQKELEYIKIKEWEEKFDRDQKLKEQEEIRRDKRFEKNEINEEEYKILRENYKKNIEG